MKLQFCPECTAELRQTSTTNYTCANGHPYYNNPRAAVAILPIRDEQVLLAVRAREPQKGKYDVIGGFVDPGETAEDAAVREFLEETGGTIGALHYLTSIANTYDENVYTCDYVYVATDISSGLKPHDDVAALEWHPIETIFSDAFAWPEYGKLRDALEGYLVLDH